MPFAHHLDPGEYTRCMQAATVVVAHAGMGSILRALQYGKPLVVMPRRGALRETRNDHQVATTRRLQEQGRVTAAFDEEELSRQLDEIEDVRASRTIPLFASQDLLDAVRCFIEGSATGPRQAFKKAGP